MNHTDVPISSKELQELSSHLCKEWKFLARALGFEEHEIEEISQDNSSREMAYQMLLRWKQIHHYHATYEVLGNALHSIQRNDLAATILQGPPVIDLTSCSDDESVESCSDLSQDCTPRKPPKIKGVRRKLFFKNNSKQENEEILSENASERPMSTTWKQKKRRSPSNPLVSQPPSKPRCLKEEDTNVQRPNGKRFSSNGSDSSKNFKRKIESGPEETPGNDEGKENVPPRNAKIEKIIKRRKKVTIETEEEEIMYSPC